MKQLHYADYFTPNAHEKLIKSLRLRADVLKIETSESVVIPVSQPMVSVPKDDDLDFYRFIKIENPAISHPFWIAKYPVTNRQYERFLKAGDFAKEEYWLGFEKFDKNGKPIGFWKDEGLTWLQEQLKDYTYFPRESWKVEPKYWGNPEFGIAKPNNPVVGITWFEANAYCKWLVTNWKELTESSVNSGFAPKQIRLPLDMEWTIAAGGDRPEGRYPWDKPGKATTDVNEIIKRANINNSKIGRTTPVNQYREGISPYGVMDMAGNVWEWQAHFYDESHNTLGSRGGSWTGFESVACVVVRDDIHPNLKDNCLGFRVVVSLLSG
ncbi:MAG: SUMF1/EgtB/PvdO family nonheme iron enzyme [Anaerolineales bacterium]|nr:SUMF1/EgtB/PvdO family nonheme iron enzyme [Anaerolineales bacterium]